MTGSDLKQEVLLAVFAFSASIAVATPKPSDGYLHFSDRIASDTMYARRGDPSAVADFAIMASASADSLASTILALLWDTSQDTTIHEEVRNGAIGALRWYERDSVETLVEDLVDEPEFELTSARLLAQWKSWESSYGVLASYEDWTTLVSNSAPYVKDTLVEAVKAGSGVYPIFWTISCVALDGVWGFDFV